MRLFKPRLLAQSRKDRKGKFIEYEFSFVGVQSSAYGRVMKEPEAEDAKLKGVAKENSLSMNFRLWGIQSSACANQRQKDEAEGAKIKGVTPAGLRETS